MSTATGRPEPATDVVVSKLDASFGTARGHDASTLSAGGARAHGPTRLDTRYKAGVSLASRWIVVRRGT
jgi:hypothetical protein